MSLRVMEKGKRTEVKNGEQCISTYHAIYTLMHVPANQL